MGVIVSGYYPKVPDYTRYDLVFRNVLTQGFRVHTPESLNARFRACWFAGLL